MPAALGSVTLKSGSKYPQFGLGTWQSKAGEVGAAVRAALDAGYVHIDSAQAYGNQKEVGEVLAEYIAAGKIARADLWVTSKIWNVFHSKDECLKAVREIVGDLKTGHVDLMLIHWPQGYKEGAGMFPKDDQGVMQYSEVDWAEAWAGLEEAKRAGLVRHIGVSNFSRDQMERLISIAKEPVDNLQVEIHPYYQQQPCLDFCAAHGISVTAYSPLANNGHMFRKEGQPDLLQDPVMLRVAEKHHKSPAQVAIRWALQRGTVVIPKSTNPGRIVQNAAVGDFVLDDKDLADIKGLEKGLRLLSLDRDLKHPHYPFHKDF